MEIKNLDTNAVIKWRLSDACNYKCDYCIRKPLVVEGHATTDDKKCVDSIGEVTRIANELYKNTGKKVKIDLIGGEVTVLPSLKTIIDSLLSEEVVAKVNITSNMVLTDVLKSIASKKVTITCSYHPTQEKRTIEEWFEQAAELSSLFGYFKVETVATKDATHIEKFVELADGYKLDYQVEEDLFNEELTGKACSSTKRNYRYEVTDDNGVTKKFLTRNMFLKQYGIEGKYVFCRNKECSRDFDYVYIEQDQVFLCADKPVPIKDYKPLKDYHPCWRARTANPYCTLCGNISIRSMKEFVF